MIRFPIVGWKEVVGEKRTSIGENMLFDVHLLSSPHFHVDGKDFFVGISDIYSNFNEMVTNLNNITRLQQQVVTSDGRESGCQTHTLYATHIE